MSTASVVTPDMSWAEKISSAPLPQHIRKESSQDQIHILGTPSNQSETATEVNSDHLASNVGGGFVFSGLGIIPPSNPPSPPPPPPPSPVDPEDDSKTEKRSSYCTSISGVSGYFTPPSSPTASIGKSDDTTDWVESYFGGFTMAVPPSPVQSDDQEGLPSCDTQNFDGPSQVEHMQLVGALPPSMAKILEPSSTHTHSEDCGCPVLQSVASHTVPAIEITPEPAQVVVMSLPGAGPHTHGPTCGCSWIHLDQEDKPGKVIQKLREAEINKEFKSAARKHWDYTRPLLPKRQPNHRTLIPGKPCLEATPEVAEDWQSDDGHMEEVEAEPAVAKAKSVSFNNIIHATSIRRYQERLNLSELSLHRQLKALEIAFENLRQRCCLGSSDSDEDEDEDMDDRKPSKFRAQDRQILRRIKRAQDIRCANEKAAIRRGALDFMMAVCVTVDTKYCSMVESVLARIEPRSIGSYVGEEREFANGSNLTKRLPAEWYRTKETSMSWHKKNRRSRP